MEGDNATPDSVEEGQRQFESAWAKNVHQWDLSKLKPQKHEPYQDGPFIKCRTPGHDHGFHIGPLKSLVKIDGRLTIQSVKVIKNEQKTVSQSVSTQGNTAAVSDMERQDGSDRRKEGSPS